MVNDHDLELDDGTEGSNVGYRSYSGPDEDPDDNSADILEEDEDLEEDGDHDEEHDDEQDEEFEDEEHGDEASPAVKKAVAAERKRMERIFDKKLAALVPKQEDAELLGAFQQDPKGVIEVLAKKFGVKLAGQEAADDDIGELAPPGKEEDLAAYIQRAVAHGVKKALAKKEKNEDPSLADVDADLTKRKLNARTARRLAYLDAMYDDWKQYAPKMSELIKADPSLGNDLDKLYEKAKQAVAKEGDDERKRERLRRTERGTRRTGERGTRRVPLKQRKGKMTYNEAWDSAKRTLSRRT